MQTFHLDRQAERTLYLTAFLCGLAIVLTLFLPRADGQLIGSDGKFYYAILRSIVFDLDFDYSNDYQLLNVDTIDSIDLTETGKRTNPFAIGTALLWLPFFLLAHGGALVLNLLGGAIDLDGSGNLYQTAVCLGSVFYASDGFIRIFRLARRWFSVNPSLLAALAMWLATPALYYVVGQPSMSHALSIWSNAIFLQIWLANRRFGWRYAGKLGLACGLLALVRWQDGIFILLPLADFVYQWIRGKLLLKDTVLLCGILLATTAVVFSPQMLMWARIYGSPLTLPQGNSFMNWFAPHPLLTLFSMRHGLITWHPVFALALIGLMPLWRRHPRLALMVLVMFLMQLYVNSAVERWWADEAFGGRRFTGLLPALVLPLSALLNAIWQTKWKRIALAGLLLLLLWNGTGLLQFRLGWVSRRDALTWKEMTIDRFCLPFILVKNQGLFPR